MFMKKSSGFSSFLSLFLLTLCFFVFSGCENFLNASKVRREIEESIAYNNAPSRVVLIMLSKADSGTVLPSGNLTVKQGYPFDVSFSAAQNYYFESWKAYYKDDPLTEVPSELVEIQEPDSLNTKITVNTKDPVQIIPVCKKRIEIDVEPKPQYLPEGVSKDRSIMVEFSKPVAQESFYFEDTEIPEDAETKTDADGNIWAYVQNNIAYLKNISITNSDDISLAQHFTKPMVNERLLIIAVDKSNPIQLENGIDFKTIKVTLSGNIYDEEDNIPMGMEKLWRYQITEKTDARAEVNITCDITQGSIEHSGTRDYSIGQKINLSFTENPRFQFVRWEYNSNLIYIEDSLSAVTNAIVLDETAGTNIKAICAPRLEITGFSPASADTPVSKNSNIIITFNQELLADSEGKAQLEKISIISGGVSVKSNFKAPEIAGRTITFKADDNNLITVGSGQTRVIEVSIPADFYYLLQDGTRITYGGNGENKEYIIDDTIYKEQNPPIVDMQLYKVILNAQGNSVKTRLSGLAFNNFVNDTYSINHIRNTVRFNATATDEESGFKQLTIKETLVQTVDGQSLNKTYAGEEFTTNLVENGIYTFSNCEYVLKADMDGVVKLEFIFEDNAGATTRRIFYVIKDTTLDTSVLLKPVNDLVSSRIPQNGHVTETFDYSQCYETYLAGHNETCTYKVTWGYSKDDCSNLAEVNEQHNIFTFERDIKQDCYVKCWAMDSAGNSTENLRVIPKQAEIIRVEEHNWDDSGWYLFYFLYNKNEEGYNNLEAYDATNFGSFVLWRYKATEDSEYSYFSHSGNDYGAYLMPFFKNSNSRSFQVSQDTCDFREGIYEIYVSYCFDYNEKSYFGPLSEPYIVYNGYSPANPVTDSQSPAFPASFTATVQPAVTSAGVREVHVNLPQEFEQTQGFSYGAFIQYKNSYFDLDFVIASGSSYNVILFAKSNKTGNLYYSTCQYQIDCWKDNIPPVVYSDDLVGGIEKRSSPNKIFPFFYDMQVNNPESLGDGIRGGMYYNQQKQAFEVEYYLIKKDDKSPQTDTIRRSDLESLKDKKITAYLKLPLDFYDKYYNGERTPLDFGENFMESYYTLVLDLRDRNDNRGLYSLVVSNIVRPELPKIYSFRSDIAGQFSFSREFTNSPLLYDMSVCYLKDGFWCRDDSYSRWIRDYNYSNVVDISITYHNDYIDLPWKKNSFVCFGSYSENYENDYYHSLYTYFLPAYELMSASDKAKYCKTKSVIPGLGDSYQLFYDSPCFVHTMAFPTDMLGDLDAKVQEALALDNKLDYDTALTAVWETKGREYGLSLVNDQWLDGSFGSATYTAPVNEIPPDYSYVTVVHFADGTIVRSDIKCTY